MAKMTAEELLGRYAAWERDFTGVDLKGVDLSGVDLNTARLSGAIFDVREVNLSKADLSGIYLFETFMIDVNLSNACFKGADGDWVRSGQQVTSFRFNNVIFDNTVMPDGSKLATHTPKENW